MFPVFQSQFVLSCPPKPVFLSVITASAMVPPRWLRRVLGPILCISVFSSLHSEVSRWVSGILLHDISYPPSESHRSHMCLSEPVDWILQPLLVCPPVSPGSSSRTGPCRFTALSPLCWLPTGRKRCWTSQPGLHLLQRPALLPLLLPAPRFRCAACRGLPKAVYSSALGMCGSLDQECLFTLSSQ